MSYISFTLTNPSQPLPIHQIHRMSSSGSISSLSVASSVGDSVAEARRRQEEERTSIIEKWQLKATATNNYKKHPTWKKPYYFTSSHNDHKNDVFCIDCRKWIKNGTQTHVQQHEDRHHLDDTTTISSSTSRQQQQQLKINQTIKLPQDAQERLTAKLVGFLIRDARPAALTEGVGFRDFVKALNPRFVMPGLKKIKAYTVAMSEEARQQVLEYIQPLKEKSPAALRGMVGVVSLDLWTDVTQVEYCAVLLHTIKVTKDGYEQKELCLACSEVDATHITGEVIQKYLEKALKDFGLPSKSIFRAVHDGDKKVIKAVRDAGLSSSLCFIHSLQRTIAMSLQGLDEAQTTLKRTKRAVSSTRRSNVQKSYLHEALVSIGAPQRVLINSGETRWGSTYDMAERMLEQRGAFPTAYALDDDRNPRITAKVFEPAHRMRATDYPFLAEMLAVYKPFRHVTTELQSAGITASAVVPTYMALLETVDPSTKINVTQPFAGTNFPAKSEEKEVGDLLAPVKKIAAQARSDMLTRFRLKLMLPLAVATCLDPRFKNLKAFNVPQGMSKKAWQVVHQQTDRVITVLKKAGRYEEEGRGEKRDADGHTKNGSFMAALNAKAMDCNAMPDGALPAAVRAGVELDFGDLELENGVDVASEITKYLRYGVAPMGPNKPGAMELWSELRKDCPALAIVAMHYLAIPASSAGVERLFSKTGLIKTKLRNRLLPQTLEMLIFTRANWDNSLYEVRPKKRPDDGEERKGGEEDEEEEDEDEEALWVELEREVAGEKDTVIVPDDDDDLGIDELIGPDFVEPDDEFWANYDEEEDRWLDDE